MCEYVRSPKLITIDIYFFQIVCRAHILFSLFFQMAFWLKCKNKIWARQTRTKYVIVHIILFGLFGITIFVFNSHIYAATTCSNI